MTNTPGPLEGLIWQLRRAFWELAALADGALAPLGVSAADRALLEWLAREEQPIGLSDLARKLCVSRQHVQQTLKRLSDSSWVRVAADPADARRLTLALTSAGRKVWRRIRAVDEALLAELGGGLEDNVIADGARALTALRAAVAETRKGP